MRKLDLKEILVPAISLLLICLVTAAALAAVNAVTQAPIAANMAAQADAARQVIFPDAVSFEDRGAYAMALDFDGDVLGFCMDGEAQGYGGLIKVTIGVNLQGEIINLQLLACEGETPGLGQKVKDESFLRRLIGGKGAVAADSIAGATFSSRGVENAVNNALRIYQEQIKGREPG